VGQGKVLPKAMDIMATQVPKGTKFSSILIQWLIYSGMTLAQTRAKLLSTEEHGITGMTAWLMSGFKLEEEQYVFPSLSSQPGILTLRRLEVIQFFSHLGKRPSTNKRAALGKRCDSLAKPLSRFNLDALKYLSIEAYNEIAGQVEGTVDDCDDEWDPVDPPAIQPTRPQSELACLPMPSSLPHRSEQHVFLHHLIRQELELCKGHANDCLAAVRQILSQEAFQYKKILRNARDKVHQTQARSSIQKVHRSLVLQSQIYSHTQLAMKSLGINPGLLETQYQTLSRLDIHVSTAVVDPNEQGQSQMCLSWIWTVQHGVSPTDNHLTECE